MPLKQAFVSPLTSIFTTQYDALGDIRFEGGFAYKYVKLSGTTTIAVGDVLCYVATDTSDQTVDGANTNFGAGVALVAWPSGTVGYGWIQIKGAATLSTALAGSPAVGDALTTNGASPPAVTKVTAANQQQVCNVINVASKIVACDFPF